MCMVYAMTLLKIYTSCMIHSEFLFPSCNVIYLLSPAPSPHLPKVANQMQLDTKHIIIPPHVYAILENRAASNESDNEEEHGKYK